MIRFLLVIGMAIIISITSKFLIGIPELQKVVRLDLHYLIKIKELLVNYMVVVQHAEMIILIHMDG